MTEYEVHWDAEELTAVLAPVSEDTPDTVIGSIHFLELGEVPDGTLRPHAGQHLKHLIEAQGFNYDHVTVINDTDNDRLNALAKDGVKPTEADATVAVYGADEDGIPLDVQKAVPGYG